MNTITRQGRTPLLSAAAAAILVASAFTNAATAQTADADADTAYVPFIVNVDAAVKAEFDPGDAAAAVAPAQISVTAGVEALMRIPLQKTIGVTYTAPKPANAPALVANRNGKITVNLPAQSYRTAEIALYSVDGKRILRGKASAASAANSISRPNVATGAYLLSVKGTDGRAAASRLTHNGGDLAINVSFGGETPASAPAERLAKKAAAGDWTITVSAAGYFDSAYTLGLKAGINAGQNITLRETPPSGYVVAVASEGAGATGGGSYAAGATVNITAGTPPDGKVFKNWTSANANVIFADANSASTIFIMPGSAVTVTANFETSLFKTVTISGKTWMAENLNVATENSWCYNNSPDNCAKYGRLYTWNAATTACPAGWHLPTRDEWGALAKAAGGTGNYGTGGPAGTKLKSTSGWNDNGNGTDDFGFSALPGGYRYSAGAFYSAGNYGYWWTATEYSGEDAYYRRMYYGYDGVSEAYDDKSGGFAVRCLAD